MYDHNFNSIFNPGFIASVLETIEEVPQEMEILLSEVCITYLTVQLITGMDIENILENLDKGLKLCRKFHMKQALIKLLLMESSILIRERMPVDIEQVNKL